MLSFQGSGSKITPKGSLEFAVRKQKIDTDPLRQEEALFAEPIDINMVDITDESTNVKLTDVYPKDDEDLLGFLYRCKSKGAQVSLCPRCSVLTDRVAAENFQKLQLERGRAQWNRRDPRQVS